MAERRNQADPETVLADARAHGDKRASEIHAVSIATIKRWRSQERARAASVARASHPIAAAAAGVVAAQPPASAGAAAAESWLVSLDDLLEKIDATADRLLQEAGPQDLRVVLETRVKLTTTRAEHEIMQAELDHGGSDGADRPGADPAKAGSVPPDESPPGKP